MNTRFFIFLYGFMYEQAICLLFLLCCFRLGKILHGNAFSGVCFDASPLRYLGDFHIPDKAVVDNDSLCRLLPVPSVSNTSMWSISSLRSGAVSLSILMNLRIAEVKVSRSLSHCPHSESFWRRVFIFAFSSNRSTSYLWDNCINHSSLTLPVALSSYSFSYRRDGSHISPYICLHCNYLI